MTTKLTTALNPISMMIQRGLIAFSPDAATPPAPPAAAAPADAGAKPAPSVAQAGKAFLATLTEEQKKAPVTLPPEKPDGIDDVVDDDEHEANAVATPPKVDDKKPDATKPDAAARPRPRSWSSLVRMARPGTERRSGGRTPLARSSTVRHRPPKSSPRSRRRRRKPRLPLTPPRPRVPRRR
jgi:hypothetical protein